MSPHASASTGPVKGPFRDARFPRGFLHVLSTHPAALSFEELVEPVSGFIVFGAFLAAPLHEEVAGLMGGLTEPFDAAALVLLVRYDPVDQRRRDRGEVRLRDRKDATPLVCGVGRGEKPDAGGADDPDGTSSAIQGVGTAALR